MPSLLRILLVDNDESAALRSEEALRSRFGDQLVLLRTQSLTESIRTLLENTVDVVVLELELADASGAATFAGVRSAAPTVPVVVYSRSIDESISLRILRAGAQECLEKATTAPTQLARHLIFAIERQRRIVFLEAARVEAAHRATHDPLTGLANRDLFVAQLERALSFGERYGRKTGLLFVDLDGFKEINDTLGHATGDLLLRTTSARLLESVRRSDGVARLGGDEFVVLLPDVTSRRDVALVRETILACLQEPVDLGGGVVMPIEASIGSAMSPLDGVTVVEIMEAADQDMYRDKELRRRDGSNTARENIAGENNAGENGRWDAAAPPRGIDSLAHRRETRLRVAEELGELVVYYQPIVDVVADRVVGAEALLRWAHPDRGLLAPAEFLQLAEDTGLIVPIGERVLAEACRAVSGWRSTPWGRSLGMNVNLSAVQLREKGFAERLALILASTDCPPDALTLELTESSTVVDGELALEALHAIKSLGVRLVVDDFGVGHASLTFLREAPVHGIKIDHRFVTRLLVDPRDHSLVSSMIRMAHGLDLAVIAEGVETAAQSQRLARLQCVVQQGRHFADALTARDFGALLQTHINGMAFAAPTRPSPESTSRGT